MPEQESLESPARVLRQFLIDQGVLGNQAATNWASYYGTLPASGGPNNAASVMDAGGTDEGAVLDTGENYFHRAVTINTRSVDDITAHAKGRGQIEPLLAKVGRPAARGGIGVVAVSVGGSAYLLKSAKVTVPYQPIGKAEGNTSRPLWSMTIKVVVRLYAVTPTTSTTTSSTTSTTSTTQDLDSLFLEGSDDLLLEGSDELLLE
jgi:hypothetical protein